MQSRQLVELFFSRQFKVHSMQCNTLALKAFQYLKIFFQKALDTESLLTKKQVQLLSNLPAEKQIFFYCSYGAAICLQKLHQEGLRTVSIFYPSQWSRQILLGQYCKPAVYLPAQPGSYSMFHIGQLPSQVSPSAFDKTLTVIIQSSRNKIESNGKKNPKNHLSPSWLRQAALFTVQYFNSNQKKQKQMLSGTELLSKGGTLDVGYHTGTTKPNTSAEVVLSIFHFFIKNESLFHSFVAALKLHLLLSIPEAYDNSRKQHLLFYKCVFQFNSYLKQMLYRYPDFQFSKPYLQQKLGKTLQLIKLNINCKSIQAGSPKRLQKSKIKLSLLKPNSSHTSSIKILSKQQIGQVPINQPFQYFSKSTEPTSEWVFRFQKTLYALAISTFKQDSVCNRLQLSEVKDVPSSSSYILSALQKYCQAIRNREKQYGLRMPSQVACHIALAKQICLALAFQCLKEHKKDLPLQQFRMPSKMNILITLFSSFNFQARQAILALCNYQRIVKSKKVLFKLDGSDQSYRLYAQQVFKLQSHKVCHQWIVTSSKQLQSLKQKLLAQIENHKQYVDAKLRQLQNLTKKKCQCTTQNYRRNKFRYIQCERCNDKQNLENYINKLQKKTENYIIASHPKNNGRIYAFLHNLNLQHIGLLNLCFYVQGSKNQTQQYNFFKINYKSCIAPYSRSIKRIQFNLLEAYKKDIESLILYPQQNTCFLYEGMYNALPAPIEQLTKIPDVIVEFSYFLKNPDGHNNKREHQVYCDARVREIQSFGLLRCENFSQIPLLVQKLLSKQIAIDCLDNFKTYKWFLPFLTASHLPAMYQITGDFFVTKNQIAFECMQQLLTGYHKSVSSKTIRELPIICCLHSLFSRHLGDPSGLLALGHKILEEHDELGKKALGQPAKEVLSIRTRQCLMSFCGLLCFIQGMCSQELLQQAVLFVNFMVSFRMAFVYASSNKSDRLVLSFIQENSQIRKRAISNAILPALKVLVGRHDLLSKLVSRVYQGAPASIVWSLSGQILEGKGSDSKLYSLQLQSGVLLIDGYQLVGLPTSVTKSENFRAIFQDKDFEVIPMKSGFMRTRANFSKSILGYNNSQTKSCKVFFEFAAFNENSIINIVYQHSQREETQQLLMKDTFLAKNFKLPKHFQDQLYWWFNSQRNLIYLRRKRMEEMRTPQLVGKLCRTQSQQYQIQCWLRPTMSLSNKNVLELPLHKLNNFRRLLQRPLQFQYLQYNPYLKLSALEKPQFIYQQQQLDQKGKPIGHIFQLPRYRLQFRLEDQQLKAFQFADFLIGENNYNEYLPWRPNEGDSRRFLCLCKYRQNQPTLMAHRLKIIIPDLQVNFQGQMVLPLSPSAIIEYRVYEMHNFFKEVRGVTARHCLFLCDFIASGGEGHRLLNHSYGHIQCLRLVRCCYSNQHLAKEDLLILRRILVKSFKYGLLSLALCVTVLLLLSKSSEELAFPQKSTDNIMLLNELLDNGQQLSDLKTEYLNSQRRGRLPFEQQLTEFQLLILGLDVELVKQQRTAQSNTYAKFISRSSYIDTQVLEQLLQTATETLREVDSLGSRLLLKKEGGQAQSRELFKLQKKSALVMELYQSCKVYQTVRAEQSSLVIRDDGIQQVRDCKRLVDRLVSKIEGFLLELADAQSKMLEYIAGHHPIFRLRHIVRIICQGRLDDYFASVEQSAKPKLLALFGHLLSAVVAADSMTRLGVILGERQRDLVAVLRQLQSPRQKVRSHPEWLCLEVQLRLQIWRSQYQMFNFMTSQNKVISQLNMGEGKTQTIIPMIVLDQIYRRGVIPRVNIMSQLLPEAKSNFFRFLSSNTFSLPLILLYFNRTVNLTTTLSDRIARALACLGCRQIQLIDRQSNLSLQLKVRQLKMINYHIKNKTSFNLLHSKFHWAVKKKKVFDIFDEADALLSARKSFVYSVGQPEPLPQVQVRVLVCYLLIECFLKFIAKNSDEQYIVFENSLEETIESLDSGCLPKGIRIIEAKVKPSFRRDIAEAFLDYAAAQREEFVYLKALSPDERRLVLLFIADPEAETTAADLMFVPNQAIQFLLTLRGLIGFKVFQNRMSVRCQVDYGIPKLSHPKRVAVPYDAADIPSQRSEFSHPEVTILLSILAYCSMGLSEKQFKESLLKLMRLNESHQKEEYESWLACSPGLRKVADCVRVIDLQSQIMVRKMYTELRRSRAVCFFWLKHCVFPVDLLQHEESITSSLWDIANMPDSLGFSGTKDNHYLFPSYVKYSPIPIPIIQSTDGKMANLLIDNTISIEVLKNTRQLVWKKVINSSLLHGNAAVIDTGALLAGTNLQAEVVPYLCEHPRFDHARFDGVSFCDSKGVWKIYDAANKAIISRGFSIPDYRTFVIFDEARTRGADFKLAKSVVALVSLTQGISKDKLMQSVGRLRSFGRGQRIRIIVTPEVAEELGFDSTVDIKKSVEDIILWACRNAVEQNEKLLLTNSKLATLHLKAQKEAVKGEATSYRLEDMYGGILCKKTIAAQCEQILSQPLISRQEDKWIIKQQIDLTWELGRERIVEAVEFNNICEREVELQTEKEKQVEKQQASLEPIEETNKVEELPLTQICRLNYKFSCKLMVSRNFAMVSSCRVKGRTAMSNRLSQVSFVLVKQDGILLISIREANLLRAQFPLIGPYSKLRLPAIMRLCDTGRLDSHVPEIVIARMIDGKSSFVGKEIDVIEDLVRKSTKEIAQTQDFLTQFISRRGLRQERYFASALHRVHKRILFTKPK